MADNKALRIVAFEGDALTCNATRQVMQLSTRGRFRDAMDATNVPVERSLNPAFKWK